MVSKTTFEKINIDDFNHDPINQRKVQSYPPELVGRFNSFIVTAFDDSMTVEMQIRTLIKWIKENIDVTTSALDNMEAFKQDSMAFQNHVKDTLVNLINQFTDKFDDNLKFETLEILNQWFIDGILSDLVRDAINEEVFNARGGKDSLGERLDETDTQLAQEVILGIEGRNAEMPLKIETYDGSGQSTHPSVLAFEGGWNFRNFWMAHTPYPNSQDEYENPSILASSDGVNWFEPTGIQNPIDKPSNEQIANGWHMSDTHLFMNGTTMECWYRLTDTSTAQDYFLRKTSLNGVSWSSRETVYTPTKPSFSPAIIVDNGKYKMWYVSESKVYYTETSTTSFDWSVPVEVDLNNVVNGETYIPWHLDVKKMGSEYILTINSFLRTSPNRRRILMSRSKTEIKFDNQKLILMPTSAVSKNWDNGSLYRSSLVKYYDEYRLYYSAIGNNTWGIGMLTGLTPETVSYKPYLTNYFSPKIKNSTIEQLNLGYEKSNLNHESLTFFTPNVKSVQIKNTSMNRLDILNENGDLATIGAYTGFLNEVVTHNLVNANPNNKFDLPKKSRANVTQDDAFWILNLGVSEVGITTTKPNTLQAVRTNGDTSADFQVGHMIVSDVPNNNTAGAIKFNNQTKGFENYNGKNWGVMTRLVSVPLTTTSTGARGDIAYGTDYMYVCISENTWRRTPLATW